MLGYGPFPNPSNPSDPSPFSYQLYIHYAHVPSDDNLRIAYGNPPFYPIHLFRLEQNIDKGFIATLPEDYVRLVVIATHLLAGGQVRLNETVKLRDIYLTFVGIVTGLRNPAGFGLGFAGVGVRVGNSVPRTNPYPHHGYHG
jgi:hypothetical protein